MKILNTNYVQTAFTSENNKKTDKTHYGLATGISYTIISNGGLYLSSKLAENSKTISENNRHLAKMLKLISIKSFVPSLIMNITCGAIIDHLTNKHQKKHNEQFGAEEPFKAHEGYKYGALLGAGVALSSIGVSLIKNPSKLAKTDILETIDKVCTKMIGGSVLGWIADSIYNKKH